MEPIYKMSSRQVEVGTKKVEKRKSLFSSERLLVDEPVFETREERIKTDEFSDIWVDADELSASIQAVCNELDSEGYEIISIMPITSGRHSLFNKDVRFSGDQSGVTRGGNIIGGYTSESTSGSLSGRYFGVPYAYAYSVTDRVIITGRLIGN
jgi:hypothetical protein